MGGYQEEKGGNAFVSNIKAKGGQAVRLYARLRKNRQKNMTMRLRGT